MQDDTNPADNATPEDEETEPCAAGEIIRPAKFGIGARATILMGLTMGAMVAVAQVITAADSRVTSSP
jgi:predicted phage tail protein